MVRSNISLTKTGQFGPTGVLVNAAGTSVQLRQTITSDGLTVTAGNAYNDGLEGLTPQGRHLEGYSSTRTVLFPVVAGTTAEQVEAKLAALPDACLYARISDDVRDILGANQLAAIASGKSQKSIADYEAQHSVTNPTTGEVMPGMYRAYYFSATKREDVDLRIRAKVAVPAAAPAELAQAPAVVTAPAAAEVAPF